MNWIDRQYKKSKIYKEKEKITSKLDELYELDKLIDLKVDKLSEGKKNDLDKYNKLVLQKKNNLQEVTENLNLLVNISNKFGMYLIAGYFFMIIFVIAPIIYYISNQFPGLGSDIKIDYYQVLATTLPIFLIALYVENGRKVIHSARILTFSLKADVIIAIVLGELLCLYAIALGASNGFIFIAVTLCLLLVIYAVIKTIYSTNKE